MPENFEQEPAFEGRRYLPETQALVKSLLENPTQAIECLFNDGLAVSIVETPGGCVAFPGIETQALCPQHRITNGSFDYMRPVVDLSMDGAWSQYYGEEPDYVIVTNPNTDEVKLVPWADSRTNPS